MHNLRHLMDEVFGPENFVATIIWQKVYSPKNSARHFSEDHDYVVVYAREADGWSPNLLPRTAEQDAAYANPDNDARGPWKPGGLDARNYYSKGTYPITCPGGRVIEGPPGGAYWRVSAEKLAELDRDKRIWWGRDGNSVPSVKRFLSEVRDGRVPQTLWTYQAVGHTQEAKKQLLERVTFASSDTVFDTPKPARLIQQLLRIATRPGDQDLVLDFFAGSGTTGDAVMQLNAADGGNRRYILVQLPEPTGGTDFPTIADITKARLRAAGDAIRQSREGQLDLGGKPAPDLGFRVFKLAASNFRVWDGTPTDPETLAQTLGLFADNLQPATEPEAVLYEIMLKAGIPLTQPVEQATLGGQPVYRIAGGDLLVCLAQPITRECLRAMMTEKPPMIVCLDRAFEGNDELLTNTVLEMKSHGITHFRTI